MLSIAKFLGRAGDIGQPLDDPFTLFAAENVRFRAGTTSMIAGQPGSFKSVFALNMLCRLAQVSPSFSAVYFSADSDEFTVGRRLAGILTRHDPFTVEADIAAQRTRTYEEALRSLRYVRFEYRPSLPLDDIRGRLDAYESVYGDYPEIAFIDNLMNYVDGDAEWARMRDMTRDLDALARRTGSHICILHHASDGWGHPGEPVPRHAIQGKVTQIPRLVLTLAASGRSLLAACVKNTNGPQYPDASHVMRFTVENSLYVREEIQETLT